LAGARDALPATSQQPDCTAFAELTLTAGTKVIGTRHALLRKVPGADSPQSHPA